MSVNCELPSHATFSRLLLHSSLTSERQRPDLKDPPPPTQYFPCSVKYAYVLIRLFTCFPSMFTITYSQSIIEVNAIHYKR